MKTTTELTALLGVQSPMGHRAQLAMQGQGGVCRITLECSCGFICAAAQFPAHIINADAGVAADSRSAVLKDGAERFLSHVQTVMHGLRGSVALPHP